jgi:hypothetical protein
VTFVLRAGPDPREDRPVDTKAVLAKVGLAKVAGYADRPWRMLIGGELVIGRTAKKMPVVDPAAQECLH